MLSSYFGQYSAFYLTPEVQETMGRTYGADLVIPSVVYRHQHLQQQQLHKQQQMLHHEYQQHFIQQQQLLLQQQQQQQHLQQQKTSRPQTVSATQNMTARQRREQNTCKGSKTEQANKNGATEQNSSSEIKFSIQRILSGDISCKKDVPTKKECPDDETDNEDVDANVTEEVNETMRYDWLQCTRYKPPKLQRARKKESCQKRKLGRNPRVPFTQHQVSALERKFSRTHYLSSMDVAELSSTLSLTETRVKIWFQNRRARERRSNNSKHQVKVAFEGHDSGGEGRDSSLLFSPPCPSYTSLVFPRPSLSPELGTKATLGRYSPQRASAFTNMRQLSQTGDEHCS